MRPPIYRKSGRGAPAIPMPGPRPGHLPPPPIPLPPPPIPLPPPPTRAVGNSSVPSALVDGPLLAGITVTVFPGRSSRSLAGSAVRLAGSATGRATVRTTAGIAANGAGANLSSTGIERRAGRGRSVRDGRTVRCWTRRDPSSTGEATFTSEVCAASVRSRCGTETAAFSLPWDPQPATTATMAASGSR